MTTTTCFVQNKVAVGLEIQTSNVIFSLATSVTSPNGVTLFGVNYEITVFLRYGEILVILTSKFLILVQALACE